jgi:acyl carrier protein
MGSIDKNNIDLKIIKVAKAVFKKEKLNIKSNSRDVQEWDSLNHIRLMISLQENFRIKFDLYEITNINSLEKWSKLIKKKLKVK